MTPRKPRVLVTGYNAFDVTVPVDGLPSVDSKCEVREILLNDPPPFITQDPSFRTEDGQFDFASYRALIQDPTIPENVLISLENLMTFPFVAKSVESGDLTLHGLWTDIGEGGLDWYDPNAGRFNPV